MSSPGVRLARRKEGSEQELWARDGGAGMWGGAWYTEGIPGCDPNLLFSFQEMLSMLGDQGSSYNSEEFPDLTMFPSFSE